MRKRKNELGNYEDLTNCITNFFHWKQYVKMNGSKFLQTVSYILHIGQGLLCTRKTPDEHINIPSSTSTTLIEL